MTAAIARIATAKAESQTRIFNARADIDGAIKGVWQACAAGEIDFAEAARRESQLREQAPPPPKAARVIPSVPIPRPRRRPELADRRRQVRTLAFSGPMPPKLACMFTPSQLAVLNIVGDEVVKNGTCRLTVDEIADRAKTSSRTVRYAIKEARSRDLLVVRRRRLTRTLNLPNIVIIVSREWLTWLERRGAWMPTSRSENKGAKRCRPQVSRLFFKKESSQHHTAKAQWVENLCAGGSP
jgi:hypothetical protein